MQGRLVSAQGKKQSWCVAEGPIRFEFHVEVIGTFVRPLGGGLCTKNEHSTATSPEVEMPIGVAESYQQYFHSRA